MVSKKKEGRKKGQGDAEGREGEGLPVLEPTVGAVETTEPSVILYIRVVLPALSSLHTIIKSRGDEGDVSISVSILAGGEGEEMHTQEYKS